MVTWSGVGTLSVAGGNARGLLKVTAAASRGNVWSATFSPDRWTPGLRSCTGSLGGITLGEGRDRAGAGRVHVTNVSASTIYLSANGPAPI
jgi:hypothetical protein